MVFTGVVVLGRDGVAGLVVTGGVGVTGGLVVTGGVGVTVPVTVKVFLPTCRWHLPTTR
ncbi:hypothetical protein [Amycolatopsis sp.]|uniref:hypothetical protein n=1 Tax=Amycolatopsis sp. TaxID=37632 RepID=UPI002E0033CB|nr:hypothetical protein [Amycolatopsis sp.]